MTQLLNAFTSCLPLAIPILAIVLLSWESRGRIESIEISPNGFKIQFNKKSR